MEQSATEGRKPGRPLSFNRDAALNAAMLLFWRHGYEATSLADLTRAMSVTPPSIYAAFGDKRRLFLAAVDRYLSGPVTYATVIDGARDARGAARALLEGSVIAFTGESTPPGCLLASAAISCSAEAEPVRAELAHRRGAIEQRLRDRIMADRDAGHLPPETDAEALAAQVIATIQGLSTMARDGAGREKLARVAALAMLAWPATTER